MECKKPMIKPSILHGFMGFVLLILRIVFLLGITTLSIFTIQRWGAGPVGATNCGPYGLEWKD